MKSNEVIFDENMEMYITPNGLNTEICLILSDGLWAYEEDLTDEYKTKITNFINQFPDWYGTAIEAARKRFKQVYKIDTEDKDFRLMNIFILFEQNEAELYGLEFVTEFDVEHGCGMKIRPKDYEIVEVGTGDVAFC